MHTFVHRLAQLLVRQVSSLERAFLQITQPARYSIVLATAADLTRRKADLIAEDAVLRQQRIVLHRSQQVILHSIGSPLARSSG